MGLGMKRVLFSSLAVLLAGCVPLVHTYYKPEFSGATYFGGSCLGGAGAPSVAYFPFEGIYLSVAVNEEPNAVRLGLHVPAGKRVQLIERETTISYNTTAKVSHALKPVALRGGNPDPWEFRRVESPFGQEDYFSELTGDTKPITYTIGTDSTAHKTYLFEAPFDDHKADTGSVSFPSMRIDGKTFEGPVVPFTKSSDFELSPINC